MKLKVLLFASAMAGLAPAASAGAPQGVWLIDGEAAVEIFDCEGMLCGRIVWLQVPNDSEGKLKHDKKNPDAALRQRQLCGMNVLSNLRPAGPDQWDGGRFYNPDSGKTHDVKISLTAGDALEARFFEGTSLLGETKMLSRIPQGASKGC